MNGGSPGRRELVTEWLPDFVVRSPAFEQLCPRVVSALAAYESFPEVKDWGRFSPEPSGDLAELELHELRTAQVRFTPQDDARIRAAGGYDYYIKETGLVPSRPGSWHDLFNALMWRHYPALKRGVHRLQLEDFAARVDPRRRTALGDAVTLLDEGGVIVLSSDPELLELIRQFSWLELFYERRAAFQRRVRVLVVGHALLHALLRPFIGLVGQAWLVSAPDDALSDWRCARSFADAYAAAHLAAEVRRPKDLHPLPLLGIPGYQDNDSADYYRNLPAYFRGKGPRG
ncbi:MAG: DUF3025 domain-containing protein [Polyangiaceae bacterium]|nr:DUF3025 domain-containing protein [Polyangiaceae bacterium]MCW5789750.1 DUF3025 domain-containing protein [Polyangiaceae bacterium]